MNEYQKKHVISRIKEIAYSKTKPLDKYIQKQQMTAEEKHKALKNRTAILKPYNGDWKHNEWFEFPQQKKYDAEYEKQNKAKSIAIARIKKEGERLLDFVQLHDIDGAKAEKMIREFEKF